MPDVSWSAARRPVAGTLVRWALPAVLMFTGLGLPWAAAKIGFGVAGVLAFFGLPWWAERHLAKLEQEVDTCPAEDAHRRLSGLEQQRAVALFAPFAWVQYQRARLLLKRNDARGAAKALGETVRLLSAEPPPSLKSLQAHVLMQDDRKAAKVILRGLQRDGRLNARDRSHLGVLLLDERAHAAEALALLEEGVREDPSREAQAALALGYARQKRFADAQRILAELEATDGEAPSSGVEDLLRRARKQLRQAPAESGPKPKGRRKKNTREKPPSSTQGASRAKSAKSVKSEPTRASRQEIRKRGKPSPGKVTPGKVTPGEVVSRPGPAPTVGPALTTSNPRDTPPGPTPAVGPASPPSTSSDLRDTTPPGPAPAGPSVEESTTPPPKTSTPSMNVAASSASTEVHKLHGAVEGESSTLDATEEPQVEVTRTEPSRSREGPSITAPTVVSTAPSVPPATEDDPWAELVAGDDDEIIPA